MFLGNLSTSFSCCVILVICLVSWGCSETPLAVSESGVSESVFEDPVALALRHLDSAPPNSIILLGMLGSEGWKDATLTGKTNEGIRYALFTGYEAETLGLGLAFGSALGMNKVGGDCELAAGAGVLAQRSFGKCVAKLLENGCVYMYKDEAGVTHANSVECTHG